MSLTPRIDNIESANNKIINSNFDFWQAGTTFTAVANGTYIADLIKYWKNGTMVHDAGQSTNVPNVNSTYSCHTTVTTAQAVIGAGDYSLNSYFVEGYDFQELAGGDFTLKFKVYTTKTGTYCVSFKNTGNTQSYIAEYTVNASNTWQEVAITVPHNIAGTWDYTNGIGMQINFVQAAGTTYQTTPNAWQAGNFLATANQVNNCDTIGNQFILSQLQLVKGKNAGVHKRAGKTIGEELSYCQRYYEKSYAENVYAGQSTVHEGAWRSVALNAADFYNYGNADTLFLIRKRAVPTFTPYSLSGAAYVWWNLSTGANQGNIGVRYLNDRGCSFYSSNSAITGGNVFTAHWTADARF